MSAPVSSVEAISRQSIRFRGRSFMALVLAPEPPLGDWLAEFDSLARRSPGFFVGKPVIVDPKMTVCTKMPGIRNSR